MRFVKSLQMILKTFVLKHNLKQKILKLTNEEEGENDDNKEEKKIKELVNNIEKEKKSRMKK